MLGKVLTRTFSFVLGIAKPLITQVDSIGGIASGNQLKHSEWEATGIDLFEYQADGLFGITLLQFNHRNVVLTETPMNRLVPVKVGV